MAYSLFYFYKENCFFKCNGYMLFFVFYFAHSKLIRGPVLIVTMVTLRMSSKVILHDITIIMYEI